MLCKKCGAQIPDDAAKCEFCNEIFREEPAPADNPPTEAENIEDLESTKVLDIDDTEQTESSDIEEQPSEDLSQRSTHEIFEENAKKRKKQTEKVVDEKQQQLEEITTRRNQKKVKQKRNKTILIICICALVAAAAGAGTFYIRNGGFTTTVIATPAPSNSPIPSLAPVATPEVSPSPSASADPEATAEPSDSDSESSNTSSSGNSGANWTATGSSSTTSSSSDNSSSTDSASSGNTTVSEGKTSAVTNTGKYSGNVSNKINSKLVIGDKVVYDEGADKYFMTFNMDGTMYYANVSRGSTTEQINGKYITVTADPTNGRYDGNTVYEISSMTYYSGDYILPESGTKTLQKSDIQNLTKDELGLARNEIYARHGRKFQMEIYQNYFEGKSWYKVNPNYDYTDDNKNLNSIELKNVSTILSVENSK